jgi:YhcH/YjgK/YiaL family protein
LAAFSSVSQLQNHFLDHQIFQKAFRYILEAIEEGSEINRRILATPLDHYIRHDLEDGMFVIEQCYFTKEREEGFFESHRKYIDMQVIVSGSEMMEFTDIHNLTIQVQYDEEKDLIVYDDFIDTSVFKCEKNSCAIFWSEDAHMPCLNYHEKQGLLYKTVVKVPISHLS